MTLGEAWTLLGFLVGGAVFWLEARRRKLATEGFGWLAIAALCGGVAGARISAWLSSPLAVSAAAHNGAAAFSHAGWNGKALLGGLVGGWLCVQFVKRKLGLRRSSGDLFALALPAGEAIGRIGCYFNGCCFGTVCSARWAVFQHGAWRHPAQIYAAFIAAIIFIVLLCARDKFPREGDTFKLYLLLFGAGRFVLEFFRERVIVWNGLSLMQILCFCLVVLVARSLFTVKESTVEFGRTRRQSHV